MTKRESFVPAAKASMSGTATEEFEVEDVFFSPREELPGLSRQARFRLDGPNGQDHPPH